MFVRIKTVSAYRYLQLVESVWQDRKPRQRVLATLGRLEQLQSDGSIEALIASLGKFSEKTLSLIAGRSQPETHAWKVGPVIVFERLWQQLGLDRIMKDLFSKRRFEFDVERAIFLCVLHRVCCGGSDRHAYQWKKDYALQGTDGLNLHHAYRAMAWLGEAQPDAAAEKGCSSRGKRQARRKKKPAVIYRWSALKDQIEKALWLARRDLFNELSLVFFDTTTLYFEGQGGESVGQHGRSKDHRPDLHQMVVGVVVDAHGEPICCEMWSGNATDVRAMAPVVEHLRQRFGIKRVCVVIDRGFMSKKNIEELEAQGWDYIVGARMHADGEVRDQVIGKLQGIQERPRKDFTVVYPERSCAKDPSPLEVKEVSVEGHRYVVCYNAEQARKDAHDRAAIVESLRLALGQGDKSLVGNKGYRKYLYVEGKHFELDEEKIRSEARYDGLWVLRTNTLMPTEQVALRYKELWMVERMFRDTKTLLKTRPIFHKRDATIRGHVFCTFLALVLLKALDRGLREAGLELEHQEVMRDLKALQRIRIEDNGKVFWLRSQVQGCCGKVFQAVGVALPPLLSLEEKKGRKAKEVNG